MVRLSLYMCLSIVVLLLCIEGKKHLACHHHRKRSKEHHLPKRGLGGSNSSLVKVGSDISSPNITFNRTTARVPGVVRNNPAKKGSPLPHKKKFTASKRVEHNRPQQMKNPHRTAQLRKKRSPKRRYQSCRNPMRREVYVSNPTSKINATVGPNRVFVYRYTKRNKGATTVGSSKPKITEQNLTQIEYPHVNAAKRRTRLINETSFGNSFLMFHEPWIDSSKNGTNTNLTANSKLTNSSYTFSNASTKLTLNGLQLNDTMEPKVGSDSVNAEHYRAFTTVPYSKVSTEKITNSSVNRKIHASQQIVSHGRYNSTDIEMYRTASHYTMVTAAGITSSVITSTKFAKGVRETSETNVNVFQFDQKDNNNSSMDAPMKNNENDVNAISQRRKETKITNETESVPFEQAVNAHNYESTRRISSVRNKTEPLEQLNKLFFVMNTSRNSTAVLSHSDAEEAAVSRIAEAQQFVMSDDVKLSKEISRHSDLASANSSFFPETRGKISSGGNYREQLPLEISEKPSSLSERVSTRPDGSEERRPASVNSSKVNKEEMTLMDFEGPFILNDVDAEMDQSSGDSVHIRVKRDKPEDNADSDAASENFKSNYPYENNVRLNEMHANHQGDLSASFPQNPQTTDPRTLPEMRTEKLLENTFWRTSNVTYVKEFPILQNTPNFIATKRLPIKNFEKSSNSITMSSAISNENDVRSESKNRLVLEKQMNKLGSGAKTSNESIENISHLAHQLLDLYPDVEPGGKMATSTLVRRKCDVSYAKSFGDTNYDYSNGDIDYPEEAGSIRKKRDLSNTEFLIDNNNDRLHADFSTAVISTSADSKDSKHQLPIVDKPFLANALSDVYSAYVSDPIHQSPKEELIRKKRMTNDKFFPESNKLLSLSQYDDKNGYNAYVRNNENDYPSSVGKADNKKDRISLDSYPEDNNIIDSMLSKVEYVDPDEKFNTSSQQFYENNNIAPSLHSMLYATQHTADYSDLYDTVRFFGSDSSQDVGNSNVIDFPEDTQSIVSGSRGGDEPLSKLNTLHANVPLRDDSVKQDAPVGREARDPDESEKSLTKHSKRHTKTKRAASDARRKKKSTIRSRRSIDRRTAAQVGDEKSALDMGEYFPDVSGYETRLNPSVGKTSKIENLSKEIDSLKTSGIAENTAVSKNEKEGTEVDGSVGISNRVEINPQISGSSNDDSLLGSKESEKLNSKVDEQSEKTVWLRDERLDGKAEIEIQQKEEKREALINNGQMNLNSLTLLTVISQPPMTSKSDSKMTPSSSLQKNELRNAENGEEETSNLTSKESERFIGDEQIDRGNIASNVQMQMESYAEFKDNRFESLNDKDLLMISPHVERQRRGIDNKNYLPYADNNFAARNNAHENDEQPDVWNVIEPKSIIHQERSLVEYNDQSNTNLYGSSRNDGSILIVKRDTARVESDRANSLSADEKSNSSINKRAAPFDSGSKKILSALENAAKQTSKLTKRNSSSRELVQPDSSFHHQKNLSPRHGLPIYDESRKGRVKRHKGGISSDVSAILGQHCQGNNVQELKYYDDVREPNPPPPTQDSNVAQADPWEKLRKERAVKSVEEIKDLMAKLSSKVDELQNCMDDNSAENKVVRKKKKFDEVKLNRTDKDTDGPQKEQLKNEAVKLRKNGRTEFQAKKNDDRRIGDPGSQKRSTLAVRSRQWWKRARKKRKSHRKWDKWTDWSSCSVTCGKGRQIRWRHCIHDCTMAETEMEEKACQLPACGPGKFLGIF